MATVVVAHSPTPSAVKTIALFNQELKKIPKGKTIALLIYRNGDTLYVPIRIAD